MPAPAFRTNQIRALVFDVFGTVVDWRASIIREGQLLGHAHAVQCDWAALADAWRAGYAPAMQRTAESGQWADIDQLHRQILDGLLPRFGLQALSEAALQHFNRAWHRLAPWPDSVGGLNRLRARQPIATLSNGNVSLLVNMSRNAGLPWDCVLSAELVKKYKPDPEVYLMAARLLGVAPHELMLVAAHPSDLRGAQRAGLRTGYVHRPLEFGPDQPFVPAPDDEFDLVARSFIELAERLGA